MERDVAVATGDERVLLRRGVVIVDQTNVGPIADLAAQAFQIVEAVVAVDRLDHEHGSAIGLERAREGPHQRQRVLALEDAEEVEIEEKQETIGQAERLPGDLG
jgi:hypothetical protein